MRDWRDYAGIYPVASDIHTIASNGLDVGNSRIEISKHFVKAEVRFYRYEVIGV